MTAVAPAVPDVHMEQRAVWKQTPLKYHIHFRPGELRADHLGFFYTQARSAISGRHSAARLTSCVVRQCSAPSGGSAALHNAPLILRRSAGSAADVSHLFDTSTNTN